MDIPSETTILIQINSCDQTHFHLLKEVTEKKRPRKVDKQGDGDMILVQGC